VSSEQEKRGAGTSRPELAWVRRASEERRKQVLHFAEENRSVQDDNAVVPDQAKGKQVLRSVQDDKSSEKAALLFCWQLRRLGEVFVAGAG
jgi:hypothetical protein